jgi:hypothetical protein
MPVDAFSTSTILPWLQPEFLADQQRLDTDEEAARAHQVVQRLHRLPGTHRAAAVNAGAHGAQDRLRRVQVGLGAAGHDRELARPGPADAA